MGEPLDEQYLQWLYGQVASVRLRNPSKTYWHLLRMLFTTEFVWLIPNDDNRMEDGRDLRREFTEDLGIRHPDPDWMILGCSLLEMLIALSRRLVFEADGKAGTSEWFWHLIGNLNLANFNDVHYQEAQHKEYVQHVINDVIWRTYRDDGQGGLFPLREPREDQRTVELWYQLANYLLEGHSA